MDTYPRVEFIRVMPTENWYMHDTWKYQLNLRQITFNDFVREVDL
jgi:3'-phosphoadenosine 5'-phosphosulfate sulfotransferase (PAPS reductase)/FAD synthetase